MKERPGKQGRKNRASRKRKRKYAGNQHSSRTLVPEDNLTLPVELPNQQNVDPEEVVALSASRKKMKVDISAVINGGKIEEKKC